MLYQLVDFRILEDGKAGLHGYQHGAVFSFPSVLTVVPIGQSRRAQIGTPTINAVCAATVHRGAVVRTWFMSCMR